MSDTVDLIVMGVEGDIPRADMATKLVKAFNQEAFTFESLLDGAYGESAPYVAQSDVERSLAQGGRVQLEKLGLVCTILSHGEKPESLTIPPTVVPSEVPQENEVSHENEVVQEVELPTLDVDTNTADAALATFKTGDDQTNEPAEDQGDVDFDLDEASGEDSALASFKKLGENDGKTDSADVDFSNDLDSIADDVPTLGLGDAKSSKIKVEDLDDSINHDFSDQIEDVGADTIESGLKEAQQAKPDFDADVSDVDFSNDIGSVGIHEEDSITPEVSKSKLEEEVAERNLNSFPKEDNDENVDFSDELETLSSDAEPLATKSEGPINEADVPEALANGAGDELEAELIDPAPIEKEKKEPVEVDDGGLSLSTDDAPLTVSEEKPPIEESDDGGLSLSNDAAPADNSVTAEAETAKASAVTEDVADSDEAADATSENEVVSAEVPSSPDAADTVADVPVAPEAVAPNPAPAQPVNEPKAAVAADNVGASASASAPASGGLVLPGQLSNAVVPKIVPEESLGNVSSNTADSLRQAMPSNSIPNGADYQDEPEYAASDDTAKEAMMEEQPVSKKGRKKLVAALLGVAALGGAGTFAFMNTGSIATLQDKYSNASEDVTNVADATSTIEKMRVEVAKLQPGADLESLSTGELLVNLSNNQSNGIVELEPYFIESGSAVKNGPRLGAAVPAESDRMIKNRQPHQADKYFDDWSNREGDLLLFLALLDNLIEKGDLEVAQQLSDRAKDKLFSVMSTQRLARAYSDVGENSSVTRLMALASRDTYAIKSPEERVLALSDYAFTEQAIGLNEGAMDTFLKTSILARSLVQPEKRTVGLSSAALYFHRSGRTSQAQDLLEQSLQAGTELPSNTAARDLAIRYIALSEARMGLFNQAMEHTKLIVDPIATVSAYHGIALAIESSGDDTNARKVLNMAYRAGSQINDEDERSRLLSKVVLAGE